MFQYEWSPFVFNAAGRRCEKKAAHAHMHIIRAQMEKNRRKSLITAEMELKPKIWHTAFV